MSEPSISKSSIPDQVQQSASLGTARELLRFSAPHQRALMRILAVSIHHGIDPTPLILGFADELSASYANRAKMLAEEISNGVEVVDALEQIPGLLPASSVLALRLAREDGTLPGLVTALMERSPEDPDDSSHEESPVAIVARLSARTFFIVAMLGFLMMKIVPEFQKMFEEFGIELPAVMKLLIKVCDLIAAFWFLLPLCLIALLPFCVPAIREYFKRWNVLTWRQPTISSSVYQRRALALITEKKQSISAGIALLLGIPSIRRPSKRFRRAGVKIDDRQDVWESLASEQVISHRDAEALTLSTDGDTQAWLLRWSATKYQNRAETRFAVLFRVILAIVHTLLGLLVILTCVAVFMTLISIINSLA